MDQGSSEGRKIQSNFDQLSNSVCLLEHDEVLRCKGRLDNADLPIEYKTPYLLPRNSRFTELVVLESHERTMHGWINSTLADVIQKFWIPKGRQIVKRVLSTCGKCSKGKAKPLSEPVTGQLPKERVEPPRPFSAIGVDFSGAIRLADDQKAYIALFTCAATRAIHLELVEDMSAPSFVSTLKRFIARRGAPSLITSDNAKTFLSTSNHLKKIVDEVPLESFLTRNRIQWKFITARSP